MIKLIGNIMIQEGKFGDYNLIMTFERKSGKLMIIIVTDLYLGQEVTQVFEEKLARKIWTEIMAAQTLKTPLNLTKYFMQGVDFAARSGAERNH